MLQKRHLPPGIVEATRDRQGRVVVLTETAMRHIERRHPELDGCELAIATAIETAFSRCRSKRSDREILYAPNLGPVDWLAVVVAYDGPRGRVVTAHGSKRGPKDSDLI
jgi:hypothetical protein